MDPPPAVATGNHISMPESQPSSSVGAEHQGTAARDNLQVDDAGLPPSGKKYSYEEEDLSNQPAGERRDKIKTFAHQESEFRQLGNEERENRHQLASERQARERVLASQESRINQLVNDNKKLRDKLASERQAQERMLASQDSDIAQLQQQVLMLKQAISRSVQNRDTISDDTLSQQMQDIASEVKSWALSISRRCKTVIPWRDLSDPTYEFLAEVIPTDFDTSPKIKLAFCEHLIWAYLVRLMRRERIPDREQEHYVFTQELILNRHKDESASYNEWRSATWKYLHNRYHQFFEERAVTISGDLADRINKAMSERFGVPCVNQSTVKLASTIEKLIWIGRGLRVQKASYEVDMPQIGEEIIFSTSHMLDQFGDDRPELRGHRFVLATFPLLTKRGDSMGENMNLKNIICKMKVFIDDDSGSSADRTEATSKYEARSDYRKRLEAKP